jgi:hypothetical protein
MNDVREDLLAECIAAHRSGCAECRREPLEAAAVAAALARSAPPVDVGALSSLALARVSGELAARGREVFRRQVIVVLLLALVPLPGMLIFGVYALRLAYQMIATVLPAAVAEYLAVSYGLSALVVLTASYATIPMLLERLRARPAARASCT